MSLNVNHELFRLNISGKHGVRNDKINKPSKSFNIESIIGHASDRQTGEPPGKRATLHEPRPCTTTQKGAGSLNLNHEKIGSHSSDTGVKNDKMACDFRRSGPAYSLHGNSRNFPYDAAAHSFNTVAVQVEALAHFHDTFSQHPGATGQWLGSLGSQWSFNGHPPSSINGAVYPRPVDRSSQQLLLGNNRDIRHMYPCIEDRYSGCYPPRYGGTPEVFTKPYRKPKRTRTTFSHKKLLELKKSFKKCQYLVAWERHDLAVGLQLSEKQVKCWFQNRRKKMKKTMEERDECMRSQSSDGNNQSPGSNFRDSNDQSDVSDIVDVDIIDE